MGTNMITTMSMATMSMATMNMLMRMRMRTSMLTRPGMPITATVTLTP